MTPAPSDRDRLERARRRDAAARGTIPIGARVLDLVTGQEGEVIAGGGGGEGLTTSIAVRLWTGDRVTRLPIQLLERPTPPRVD